MGFWLLKCSICVLCIEPTASCPIVGHGANVSNPGSLPGPSQPGIGTCDVTGSTLVDSLPLKSSASTYRQPPSKRLA